ncbi:MAG TPA: PQQ-binding-like beta-propeller repeat protein [Bacteroidales bacterium]|nr:PQQ-binding-like beta-propeller repeat protein [Bacteroidales bacterium]
MLYTVLLFSFLSALNAAPDNKIHEWRGPDRSGIYNETGLLKTWPEGGPAELWVIDNLGNGYGSPTFTDDSFFITGETDTTCTLFCFDLKGTKKWQVSLGREWVKSCPGSRSAPTVTGDLLYTGTGMGNLFCINVNTGKIIWSKNLSADFGGVLPLHGHSEAPVIDENMIFWTAGGKEHNVVALDRFTGKLIWSDKGFGEPSAYNQPKIIKHGSLKIFVTFSSYHLMGLDAQTGKLLWSHEQDNYPVDKRGPGYGDTHCNSVIYEDGSLWYVAGDGNGTVKLDLSPDGKRITQVWRNPAFDSYMGGAIKIGNYIYGCGVAKPELKSINSNTGILTDSLRIGTGALIAADNMLYYYTQKGEMILVSYNNGNIEKVSSFRISKGTKEHFSHPVINKGILYQRHGKVLIAYDIKKEIVSYFN